MTTTTRVKQFQAVHFVDRTTKEPREIVLLYALGEDGIVYEFSGGNWLALPIKEGYVRELAMRPADNERN
jgi:hypothetical protein